MVLRGYTPAEAAALAEVFRDAVATLGSLSYSPAHVSTWAASANDLAVFGERLNRGLTLIAEIDGNVAAFGQLHPADHVEMLYCRGVFARRGVATAIHQELEAAARATGSLRLTTDASRAARPFFVRHGYAVDATEHVMRGGLSFERFSMSKPLV